MYDSVLTQHILLRRMHLSAVENSAANVLEMEKFLHNLMGMGMVLPVVAPLPTNLLRTYEALTEEIQLTRDWMELSSPGLNHTLAKEFYEREMTLIGVLDWNNSVILNHQELIGNAIKLLAIARSMKMIVQATEDIAKMCTENFGEKYFSSSTSGSSLGHPRSPAGAGKNSADVNGAGLDKTKLFIQIDDAMDFENHLQYKKYALNDIVLLTCDSAQFPYIEGGLYEKRETLQKPMHYIFGCGLNTSDLRRCNFSKCAGRCIFYSGDISRGGSTSAMTMMVVLSIMDIVKAPEGSSPAFPIMVELEGLANLPYFPPYGSDPRLLIRSSRDYFFEPSYLLGNTLSRKMLFPILLRTYFVDEFLDVMSIMINGHNDDEPSLGKVLLSQFEAEMTTCKDVTDHFLNLGYLPLALHRLIHDPLNTALAGHRFVFTNPPPALPVEQDSDALFLLTSAPQTRQP
eukprot:gene12836-8730_t